MMDREIKKRSALYRYRRYWIGGGLFLLLAIYAIIVGAGGRKLRVNAENLTFADVRIDKFLEYIDTEASIQPSLILKINAREGGYVTEVLADDGSMVSKGDTILVLANQELSDLLMEERSAYESKLLSFQEKELDMQKSALNLRQNLMNARYEMRKLENSFQLDREEFEMGVKSRAQLEVSRQEYEHKKQTAELQMEGLRADSAASILRRQSFENEIEREKRAYQRSMDRLSQLVVRAPIDGQLSGMNAALGQSVAANTSIGEVKVLDPYKMQTTVSEYYIDRVVQGLPAYAMDQGVQYPLIITKVNPEVTERAFRIDLAFAGEQPDNVRIGKTYRINIELDQAVDAIVIPRGDFYPVTGGQWVFRVNAAGTRASKAYITIGRQNTRHYEVTSGLEAGDRIIVSGYAGFGDAAELILK